MQVLLRFHFRFFAFVISYSLRLFIRIFQSFLRNIWIARLVLCSIPYTVLSIFLSHFLLLNTRFLTMLHHSGTMSCFSLLFDIVCSMILLYLSYTLSFSHLDYSQKMVIMFLSSFPNSLGLFRIFFTFSLLLVNFDTLFLY